MKKAYILAYQRATNYGAVLQIYALKKVLESKDVKVEVIDYIPYWMKVTLKNQPSVLSYLKRKLMNRTFDSFFGRLGLTKESYYSNADLCSKLPEADYYFVGSDQVWNTNIMKEDISYFLNFAPKQAKKVGYAVSMGNNPIASTFLDDVKEEIKHFDAVSVREMYVSEFVSTISSLETQIVLDPTLLLSCSDYDAVCDSKKFNKEYIVVYSAMRDENLYSMAIKLSNQTGLPIINLGYHFKGAHKHEYFKSPGNWLNRIKQAKYFLTNSFHGTVFSILMKKEFYVVPNTSQPGLNARFVELLNSLNLENRLINTYDELLNKLDSKICFNRPLELLEKRKEDSISFINRVLD
ncbi:polysaccharide pyruvyl transferase family protein [Aureibacter tunicatorum]|uniref:Polysaccharide pyruvyl transferase domain-containing protein n=1 Tax=Aureibacter tunicatorum TaxID=866807 RepID=A0AAE3XP61_9BACT|nr:polysaccharide pyruvyl transferase family protein [Aureibacter tunicatorum]MDR6240153.1 hypothetical protein [Aureibacter tunicatorum]BDD05966.1 hypothetical protein AUTU_34490 [Aureibacter tunicatorum]